MSASTDDCNQVFNTDEETTKQDETDEIWEDNQSKLGSLRAAVENTNDLIEAVFDFTHTVESKTIADVPIFKAFVESAQKSIEQAYAETEGYANTIEAKIQYEGYRANNDDFINDYSEMMALCKEVISSDINDDLAADDTLKSNIQYKTQLESQLHMFIAKSFDFFNNAFLEELKYPQLLHFKYRSCCDAHGESDSSASALNNGSDPVVIRLKALSHNVEQCFMDLVKLIAQYNSVASQVPNS